MELLGIPVDVQIRMFERFRFIKIYPSNVSNLFTSSIRSSQLLDLRNFMLWLTKSKGFNLLNQQFGAVCIFFTPGLKIKSDYWAQNTHHAEFLTSWPTYDRLRQAGKSRNAFKIRIQHTLFVNIFCGFWCLPTYVCG